MTFENFKTKVQTYSEQIQNAIERDSGAQFIQILSSPEERKYYHGAHFISKRFEGKGDSARTYITPYYVTFSHTKFDGNNYLTIRKEFLNKTKGDLRVLFITDSGYSVSTVDFLLKNGYDFNGSKRFEKLWAVDFRKLVYQYHMSPSIPILWEAKYLAFHKYGDTQFRGSFKVEFFRDKDMTLPIYENSAGSAKSLYEKLVHEANFDMKMSTFFWHVGKAGNNGKKVIKYKGPNGKVLYVLLTVENKKPNKNHRVSEDEFEEEILPTLPAEISEELRSCESFEEAKNILFWKYHILCPRGSENFVKFKFRTRRKGRTL